MKALKTITLSILAAVLLAGPAWAKDEPQFARMIIFGDSLSDPGNAFALGSGHSVPPYSGLEGLVPSAPYATGGHHFTNGETWIEQLAKELRMVKDAHPAFQVTGAQNFAIGGARTSSPAEVAPPHLDFQVGLVTTTCAPSSLADAVVVILVGGNDLRDAIQTAASGNPAQAIANLQTAAAQIAGYVAALNGYCGADKFLVGTIPNVAITPAIREQGMEAMSLAAFLSVQFDAFLNTQLGPFVASPAITLARFNIGTALNQAIVEGEFTNTEDSCVTPGIPPFRCRNPGEFLFWDGIHPTRTGHEALKDQALADLRAAGLVD